MIELCTLYSGKEMIIFLVIFACAVKGIINFLDWAINRINQVYKKQYLTVSEKKRMKDQVSWGIKEINNLDDRLDALMDRVDLLIDSDKDDIKAFLTKEHHTFMKKGWIDTFSLECCEKRYEHYQKEGGNSFIGNFMRDLRELPTSPPNKLDKEKKL